MAIAKIRAEEEQSCLVRFYKIVLGWDYLALQREAKKRKDKGGGASSLKKVKDTYLDVEDYLSTFEPLLFEEVKAQITQRSDEEEDTSVPLKKMGIVKECNESEGFYFLRMGVNYNEGEKEIASQSDVLLLSYLSKGKSQTATEKLTYAFALVEHRQTDFLRLRLYLHNEAKSSQRLVNMCSHIREVDSIFSLFKVCSLSTIMREFVALHSITYLPFRDLILKAAVSDAGSDDHPWKIPQQLMQHIENSHNASQLEAIHAGLSRKPFVLIQGPPGTGKTQTILGLLSAILHSTPARMHTKQHSHDKKQWPDPPMSYKYQHWSLASPWLFGNNKRDEVMPVNGDDGFFPVTGSELKPEVVDSSRKYRVRVLVCAPSNSALDEIVLRVLNRGIHDENDQAYNPKIVRIGLKAHHSVQSVSMDYLVEQKLAGIGDHLTADKQKQGASAVDRDSIRSALLDEAVIVFSTLSFSGSSIFTKLNRTFDVVIIDEAAQAVEPATLIPLSSGCKQVFLVGDPVQLPATVISPRAENLGYGMSLFKRFQTAGYPVVMLKTQYRMHPQIRSFPSKEFYTDSLEDGTDIGEQTKRAWHGYRCFGPFCFFDIHESIESEHEASGSKYNDDEVEFALLLYQKLVTRYPELKSSSMLAIISPYGYQVKRFRQRFKEMFGVDSDKFVDINTVDGFQGREKDVAIFSCVRSSKDKGIGFVSDFRRMNVGITRARSSVLVVGSASTLKRDEHWSNLIESAETRDCLFQVSKPYASFFSDQNLKQMEAENDRGNLVEDMENDDVYGNPDEAIVGVEENDDGDDYGGGDYGGGGEDD